MKGPATRAQLFFPCRPSSQLFCFWLLASLGSERLGGGGWICRKKPARQGTEGHIQENNVVGRSRKRVRGEGRTRENREAGGGGRKAAVACPTPGMRATLNAIANIFCHPSPEIPAGGGGKGEEERGQ